MIFTCLDLTKEVKFLYYVWKFYIYFLLNCFSIIFIFAVYFQPLNERNLDSNDVPLVCDSLVGFLGQYFRAITGW